MKKFFTAGPVVRVFLGFVSLIIWIGIWLTGFETVHWFLYLPAAFLAIASLTGFCPGLLISSLIVKKPDPDVTA